MRQRRIPYWHIRQSGPGPHFNFPVTRPTRDEAVAVADAMALKYEEPLPFVAEEPFYRPDWRWTGPRYELLSTSGDLYGVDSLAIERESEERWEKEMSNPILSEVTT